MKRFLRQDYMRHSRLGKSRKKLQKWIKPKGRHSKMRKMRRSYPPSPTVGHKSPKAEKGKLKGYIPILISSANQLNKLGKDNGIILSKKLGARKRLELIKKAEEMHLKILNVRKLGANK